MRKVAMVVLCSFLLIGGLARADDSALTNKDVIEMVGMGLSDQVIVEKIRTAPATNFVVDMNGLRTLTAAKVSSTVIAAMINPKVPPAPPPAMMVVAPVPPAPQIQEFPGFPATAMVAYKKPDGSFLPLEQCVSGVPKGKGFLGAATGFGKMKFMGSFRGLESTVRINERRPVFYLRNMPGVKNAFLVRLAQKGDRRELQTASTGGFRSSEGIPEKDRIELAVANVGGDIVSATPKADLPDGEYLITVDEYAVMSYDFGIAAPQS